MTAKVLRGWVVSKGGPSTRRLGGWPRAEGGETQAPPPSDRLGGCLPPEPSGHWTGKSVMDGQLEAKTVREVGPEVVSSSQASAESGHEQVRDQQKTALSGNCILAQASGFEPFF